jgi:hypothetical protein
MIAAGVVCIGLGAWLFRRSMELANSQSAAQEELSGELFGMALKVSNLTPGTAFAFIGILLIGLQFTKLGPTADLDFVAGELSKVRLRGGETTSKTQSDQFTPIGLIALSETVRRAPDNNPSLTVNVVQDALTDLAPALNDIAWVTVKAMPDNKVSRPFAELAVHGMPNEPEFLDTLAVAYEAEGDLFRTMKVLKKMQGLLSREDSRHQELDERISRLQKLQSDQ